MRGELPDHVRDLGSIGGEYSTSELDGAVVGEAIIDECPGNIGLDGLERGIVLLTERGGPGEISPTDLILEGLDLFVTLIELLTKTGLLSLEPLGRFD